MRKRSRLGLLWFILTIAWMAFIFMKSAEPYSVQDMKPALGSFVSEEKLLRYVPRWEFFYDGSLVSWREPYHFVEFFIRKCGHIAEFALLTLLLILTLSARVRSKGLVAAGSGLIAVLYACSDEWHQTFVPGRTGHLADVAVDSIGVALVLAAYAIVIAARRRR
ncbi:VanZ family protein [Paenibacillus melissococcoides]|uniref:VanZ family protein n=1 Tax=Paenibacillus melissococcoides TaxID=2912268 RepID=A0ABN8U3F8_9BACL|nr:MULTISPECIES: VanZ family protein [Paenibacillus]MEB9895444.1 VanZ family protein [Bacillus cereus]CAH8245602.1 VanZ family protein [Paenibacillus melissococcoides]CAH8711436.1 VanZ family protein [Paenibacillus melissococcoides]CAH8712200.1 VanZ family protein [Paenibacillus melissococcoides]GIO76938.1 teicoplanin resistance protein VanZ [Paenibacillus dendritiformis]